MKNFLIILIIFLSFPCYSQVKSKYKFGVFGNVCRSDLHVVPSLNGDGKTKYFPMWEPIVAGGFGITAKMQNNNLWYNSISLKSRTYGFEHELGIARYRYIDIEIATGIIYKSLIVNIGTGIGINYKKVFIEGSPKKKYSTVDRNNYNKSVIIPIDFEIGFSPGPLELSVIFQTIGGELFKNMIVLDTRIYNYPFNIGGQCSYIFKNRK